MKYLTRLLALLMLMPVLHLRAQKTIRITSPGDQLVCMFRLENKTATYRITYKGKTLVDYSEVGLRFTDADLLHNLRLGKPVFRDTTEDYELVVGKVKKVHTRYREVAIPLEQEVSPHKKFNFIIRAFDDGIAFRYVFPAQKNWSSFTLLDENTCFRLSGNPLVHALLFSGYTSSHEGIYRTMPLSEVREDTLLDMPALFEFPGAYMAITEASLLDYAGMYLSRHSGVLCSRLSPWPHEPEIKVKAVLPHRSPWRVLLISDRVGALLESNIITTLNEPCAIKDVSWIKPGKTTFPWWNGNVVPDTLNAPGNNFVTAQHYIDFCARNQLEYHSVVEYGLHQWYVDDGIGFQPGPHSDVTTPVPGLDMQRICDYARAKGVGIRVWVHWAALYPRLDTAFTLFEKWGIKGMMVDFMDRDDQQMVNIQTEILQKAAAHHLHIQFHGAYKPTGLNRTYPNEFTREGTRNYEVDKWEPHGLSPDDDVNIPFTRMLAGSTDYHLGGFRAVQPDSFITQYTRPLVLGTRCHMLAMYAVLENYLQMVCDYPAAYEGQPGFEFIRQVPTTWDEIKVLDAQPGRYIVVARRKNRDWYVGMINNHEAREIRIPLGFLAAGQYHTEIYKDAPDVASDPDHLVKESVNLTRKDVITIEVSSGGGAVMVLKNKGGP